MSRCSRRNVLPWVLAVVVLALPSTAFGAISWTLLEPTDQSDYTWINGRPVVAHVNYAPEDQGPMTTRTYLAYGDDYDVGGSQWPGYTCNIPAKPWMGVFFTYSDDPNLANGSWAPGQLMSQNKQHADGMTLDASGSDVHYVYRTQDCYAVYPAAWKELPRVMYYRKSNNYGMPGSWTPPIRMTGKKNQVDYPSIAAGGNDVFIVWTNKGLKVKLAQSHDGGMTWAKSTYCTTTNSAKKGFWYPGHADPQVAYDETTGTLIMTCITNKQGRLDVYWSDDAGTTIEGPLTLANSSANANGSFPGIDDAPGRLGVGWTTDDGTANAPVGTGGNPPDGVWYREYNANTDSWGATSLAQAIPFTANPANLPVVSRTDVDASNPAVGLQGSSNVGVAWAGCKFEGCPEGYYDDDTRWDMNYSESTSNGTSWAGTQMVYSPLGSQNIAQGPDVIWYDGSTRAVFYNFRKSNWYNYEVRLNFGTGMM